MTNRSPSQGLRWQISTITNERTDDHRSVGLGPLHDWSSHAADAFGLMAIAYEEPSTGRRQPIHYPKVYYA